MKVQQWEEESDMATADKRAYILQTFDDWLDKSEPTVNDCIEFVDSLKDEKSSGTLNNYMYAVIDYIKWMKKEDAETVQDYDEAEKAGTMIKEELDITYSYEVSDDNYLTREQVKDIFNHTHRTDYSILWRLMYYEAMRIGECISLTWDDIDLHNGTISFYPEKKDDPQRVSVLMDNIPESERLINKYYREEENATGDFFNFQQRAARKRLSMITEERCPTFDSKFGMTKAFRHSISSHLRQDGIPMEVISKEIVRHSQVSTTQDIYASHISEDEKQQVDRDNILNTGADESDNSSNRETKDISDVIERYDL